MSFDCEVVFFLAGFGGANHEFLGVNYFYKSAVSAVLLFRVIFAALVGLLLLTPVVLVAGAVKDSARGVLGLINPDPAR